MPVEIKTQDPSFRAQGIAGVRDNSKELLVEGIAGTAKVAGSVYTSVKAKNAAGQVRDQFEDEVADFEQLSSDVAEAENRVRVEQEEGLDQEFLEDFQLDLERIVALKDEAKGQLARKGDLSVRMKAAQRRLLADNPIAAMFPSKVANAFGARTGVGNAIGDLPSEVVAQVKGESLLIQEAASRNIPITPDNLNQLAESINIQEFEKSNAITRSTNSRQMVALANTGFLSGLKKKLGAEFLSNDYRNNPEAVATAIESFFEEEKVGWLSDPRIIQMSLAGKLDIEALTKKFDSYKTTVVKAMADSVRKRGISDVKDIQTQTLRFLEVARNNNKGLVALFDLYGDAETFFNSVTANGGIANAQWATLYENDALDPASRALFELAGKDVESYLGTKFANLMTTTIGAEGIGKAYDTPDPHLVPYAETGDRKVDTVLAIQNGWDTGQKLITESPDSKTGRKMLELSYGRHLGTVGTVPNGESLGLAGVITAKSPRIREMLGDEKADTMMVRGMTPHVDSLRRDIQSDPTLTLNFRMVDGALQGFVEKAQEGQTAVESADVESLFVPGRIDEGALRNSQQLLDRLQHLNRAFGAARDSGLPEDRFIKIKDEMDTQTGLERVVPEVVQEDER